MSAAGAPRRWFLGLGVLAVTTLLAGSLAEAVLRLMWPQRYEPHRLHSIVWFHPTRAFSFLPGARFVEEGVEYSINELGFRDAPFGSGPAARPEAAHRVLVLGDSFIEGIGLSEPQTLPRQLERVLRRRLPGRSVEVRNWGVRAGSPAYYRLWLEDHARLAAPPGVVVIGLFDNDLAEDARSEIDTALVAARALRRVPGGLRWLHLAHLPARWAVARVSGKRSALADRIYGFPRPKRGPTDINPQFGFYHAPERWLPAWENTRVHLEALLQQIRTMGSQAVFVYFPLLCVLPQRPCHQTFFARHPVRTPFRDWVTGWCAERGLACVDSLPLLQARDRAGQRSFLANGHLDPEGSAELAEELAVPVAAALGAARP